MNKMINEGLLNEVESLINNQDFLNNTASQAIGYKEFTPYFKKEITSIIEVLKQYQQDKTTIVLITSSYTKLVLLIASYMCLNLTST